MKNTVKLLAIGALTLISIVSYASSGSSFVSFNQGGPQQGGPPSFDSLLEEMDANEDGLLAEDEVKGPLAENFSTIDTDEDGYISEEEFNNAPKPERKKR